MSGPVPPRPVEDDRVERLLPAWLSGIAGMVDVIGWQTLGGLFTAHITGNLVSIAADVVEGHRARLASVIAVPMFVVVAAAMGVIVQGLSLPNERRESLMMFAQTAFLFSAALLALATSSSSSPSTLAAGAVGMLAVSAMASQNALLHLSRPHAPTTAVMTGNVVTCTLALVTMLVFPNSDDGTARTQWRATWPILLGFLAGCAAGAGAVRVFGDGAWLAAASGSLLIWGYRSARRRGGAARSVA